MVYCFSRPEPRGMPNFLSNKSNSIILESIIFLFESSSEYDE
ncbi:uncharacterized protein METZ01_LOCUS10626 [marine metagenome]|uniref:Uncharacterized protein n=1 Tax=marine metagenome TaxID=408172 RepID=A0A381NT55_9ZZZZ